MSGFAKFETEMPWPSHGMGAKMTCSELYAELKGWQTVIGSVLGFLALMGGALFNAHLNRKRDDRLRIAEANVIALSLYGEINLLRSEAATMANGIGSWFTRGGYPKDEPPEYYKELFPLPEPKLYNALASKIGLLEASLLLPVTKFYSDYEAAAGHFPKLFENEKRGISYGVE